MLISIGQLLFTLLIYAGLIVLAVRLAQYLIRYGVKYGVDYYFEVKTKRERPSVPGVQPSEEPRQNVPKRRTEDS